MSHNSSEIELKQLSRIFFHALKSLRMHLVAGEGYRGHREHQRGRRPVFGRSCAAAGEKVVGLDPHPGLGELGRKFNRLSSSWQIPKKELWKPQQVMNWFMPVFGSTLWLKNPIELSPWNRSPSRRTRGRPPGSRPCHL